MNERIKLLVEEARLITVDDTTRYASDDEFEQRFAELIVRECASRVDNILREKKDGGGTMGDEIREHFGVEE